MSENDKIVGLSLDLATANAKTIAAAQGYDDDCMDEIDGGSEQRPASLTLFPNGGAYVLMASTSILQYAGDMLLKCPVEQFINIFTQLGLSEELSMVPAR